MQGTTTSAGTLAWAPTESSREAARDRIAVVLGVAQWWSRVGSFGLRSVMTDGSTVSGGSPVWVHVGESVATAGYPPGMWIRGVLSAKGRCRTPRRPGCWLRPGDA